MVRRQSRGSSPFSDLPAVADDDTSDAPTVWVLLLSLPVMPSPRKPKPLLLRLILLPIVPLAAVLWGTWSAFRQDTLSGFVPTFVVSTWETLLCGFAINSFWPNAGFCWHYDPVARPERPWKRRFVLSDPVEANLEGWTWSLSGADEVARAWHRGNRPAV